MKTVQEVIGYAKEYLWLGMGKYQREEVAKKGKPEASDQKLHGALQYKLCEGFDRLMASFGEVTKKDVAMMIEAWVIAQGTRQPAKPLDAMEWSDG